MSRNKSQVKAIAAKVRARNPALTEQESVQRARVIFDARQAKKDAAASKGKGTPAENRQARRAARRERRRQERAVARAQASAMQERQAAQAAAAAKAQAAQAAAAKAERDRKAQELAAGAWASHNTKKVKEQIARTESDRKAARKELRVSRQAEAAAKQERQRAQQAAKAAKGKRDAMARLRSARDQEKAATQVAASRHQAYERAKRVQQQALRQAELVKAYKGPGDSLQGLMEKGQVARAHNVMGQDAQGRVDRGMKDAKSVLEATRQVRRRQERGGGDIVDQRRLQALDQRMLGLVEEWVDDYDGLMTKVEALKKKAAKGDKQALAELRKLIDSKDTKRIFDEHAELWGKRDSGDAGLFDRWVVNRQEIATAARKAAVERLKVFVESEKTPWVMSGVADQGTVEEAEEARRKLLTGPDAIVRASLAASEQRDRDYVSEVGALFEARGEEFRPDMLVDSRVVERAIALRMEDWERRWWEDHGGRPEEGLDLEAFGRDDEGSEARIDEFHAKWDEFEAERAKEEERANRILGGRPVPGILEKIVSSVLQSPAFHDTLNVIGSGAGVYGSGIRVAGAAAGGEIQANVHYPAGQWDGESDLTPEQMGMLKRVVPDPVWMDDDGRFLNDAMKAHFQAWAKTEGVQLGWQHQEGVFGIDQSPEAQKRAQEALFELADAVGSGDPMEVITGLNEYGFEAFPDNDALSLATAIVVDPFILLKPTHLVRIAQFALATGSKSGAKAGMSLLLQQLAKNRLGFKHMSDELKEFVDVRFASKVLGRPITSFDQIEPSEYDKLAAAMAEKGLKDPRKASRLKRFFTRRQDSPEQLRAAAEAFIDRARTARKVRSIESADQAAIARDVEALERAEAARLADEAADLADEAAEGRQRAVAREVRQRRLEARGDYEVSPYETHMGFRTPKGEGHYRAPSTRNVHSRIQGARAKTWYGKTKERVTGPRVAVSVGDRHMQHVIAIADGLARKHGLGVRWVRSRVALEGGRVPGVELWGGSAEKMAVVAAELEDLLVRNRLGQKVGYDGWQSAGEGRVLQRGGARMDAAIRRQRAARDSMTRSGEVRQRILGEAKANRAEIERLSGLARGGDKAAAGKAAKLWRRQETLMKRARAVGRLERSAREVAYGKGRGLRYTQAKEAAQARLLAEDHKYLDRQISQIRSMMKGASPERQHDLGIPLQYMEDAKAGADIFYDELSPGVREARKLAERHGDELAGRYRPSRVAPYVDVDGVPDAGLSRERVVGMEVGRGLRAKEARSVIAKSDDEAAGVLDDAFEADGTAKAKLELPHDPRQMPWHRPQETARTRAMSNERLVVDNIQVIDRDPLRRAFPAGNTVEQNRAIYEAWLAEASELREALLSRILDDEQVAWLYQRTNFHVRGSTQSRESAEQLIFEARSRVEHVLDPRYVLYEAKHLGPEWDQPITLAALAAGSPVPQGKIRVFRGSGRKHEGAVKVDVDGHYGAGIYATPSYDLAKSYGSGSGPMSMLVDDHVLADLSGIVERRLVDVLADPTVDERVKGLLREVADLNGFPHDMLDLPGGGSLDIEAMFSTYQGSRSDHAVALRKHGYGGFIIDADPASHGQDIQFVITDPDVLLLERAEVGSAGRASTGPTPSMMDAAVERQKFLDDKPRVEIEIEQARIANRQKVIANEAARGTFRYEPLGLSAEGRFVDVYPLVRRAMGSVDDWNEVPEIREWVAARLLEVEQGGGDWQKLGRVPGTDPGVPGAVVADEVDVEQALERLYQEALRREGQRLDAWTWELYREVDAEVTEAVNKALERESVKGFTGPSSAHLLDDADEEGILSLAGKEWDWDTRALAAKHRVLAARGIPVGIYDEARAVLRDALMQEDRAALLHQRALDIGGDYRTAYLQARDEFARDLAKKQFVRDSARANKGAPASVAWQDYLERLEADQLRVPGRTEVSPWQSRLRVRATRDLAGVAGDPLDDDTWRQIMAPIAPSTENSRLAREYLVERGHWSPKTAEDIKLGRKVWSAEEERAFYRENWGTLPKWVDEEYLMAQGAFDSSFAYAKVMRDHGVYDNAVDLEMRWSGDAAYEQQLRLIWGDELGKVKPMRTIAEQREWMTARWGEHITERYVPWLMDPSSSRYAEYLAAARRRKVDLDTTLLSEADGKALLEVLERRGAHEAELLLAAGDDVVLAQSTLEATMRLTDDLLANPRFRKFFSWKMPGRQHWGYSALSALGFWQRLFIITDPAFLILNRLETNRFIGPKKLLSDLSLSGRGMGKVRPETVARFPTIETTGVGSGTSLWEVAGGGPIARARAGARRATGPAPTADDMWDMVAGGTQATTETFLRWSAAGENAVKLDRFHKLFQDRFDDLLRRGYSAEDAATLAQAAAVPLTKRFYPSLADAHWAVKSLNDLIPFLHYGFESTRLYAREFISHPWVIQKLWVIGNAVEKENLERWEAEHPDVDWDIIPRSMARQMRMLQVKVGDETFAVDLLSTSDIFRGFKAIVMMGDGEYRHFGEYLNRFIRIPHPQQKLWWAYLMGEPNPYTGEPVSLGEMMFPAKALEWWGQSMEDGSISQADTFRMLTRTAFFAEAEAVDPLRAMSAMWGSLQETNPDAAAMFLEDHPELKEYWLLREDSEDMADLRRRGILPRSWLKEQTPEQRLAWQAAQDELDRIYSHYDERLSQYLASGGSPTDEAYKALREERYRATTTFRFKTPALRDRALFYSSPAEWGKAMEELYVDRLWETYNRTDALKPKESDYQDPVKYQQDLAEWYRNRSAFLEGNPEMLARAGAERTVLEDAVAVTYDRIGDRLDKIGQTNIEIAKAEKAGKDDLKSVLYDVQRLHWLDVNRSDVAMVDQAAPEFEGLSEGLTLRQKADAVSGLGNVPFAVIQRGLGDQKWRDTYALPGDEGAKARKEIRRNQWYVEEIGKVHDAAKDGKDWIQRMESRPQLLKEYLARNPEQAQMWADRRYYHRKLDQVMDDVKRTGDWGHWWRLMEKDDRFRQYYLQTHPEKSRTYKGDIKNMKKMNLLLQKAQSADDWAIVTRGLTKDKGLREWWLSLEPGRKARWEQQAKHYAKVGPVVERAVKTGDWSEWRKLMRTDAGAREQFFANDPKARERWLRDESYQAALGRWLQLARAKKNAEASDYFAALPRWMRDRYMRENKRPMTASGGGGGGMPQAQFNAYVTAMKRWGSMFESKGGQAAMAYFNGLPAWMREFYYKNNPGKREQFASNSAYGSYMGKWVSFFEKGDHDGANAYFDSLPLWVRQRYYRNNPDKRPGAGFTHSRPPWADDDKWSGHLSKYLMMTAQEKTAFLKRNPGFGAFLRGRGDGEEARRSIILAGYKALPKDPWLRRVYRERYPEVFSEEAQYLRRQQRFEEFLTENPGMADEVADAIDVLTSTYLGSVQGYGARPRELTLERLNEEKRRKRYRRIRAIEKPEWEIAGNVPRIVPGLQNVLTGVA